MNFTDSPFERMMKQVPCQGGGRAKPCRGTAPLPRRKPKEKDRPEHYRDIVIASDNGVPAKSQTLRGEEAQRSGADFGPNWPEVAERSL